MCFQNLLLGGPVIVVLEKHSPLKVPFVFTSRGCVLGGGGNVITQRKTNVSNTFQCLLLNLLK